MASGGSQPGSAPPSLPQSPSARRGVNLLDDVVSFLPADLSCNYLQCFDAVGWAAGRASGL